MKVCISLRMGLLPIDTVVQLPWVMDHVIECPKHNGRFDIRDGRPLGAPVCVALKTYPAKVEAGKVFIEV